MTEVIDGAGEVNEAVGVAMGLAIGVIAGLYLE